MAYKFSASYSTLIQIGLIAFRMNRKIEAIQSSNLFKIYITADTQKNSFTTHLHHQAVFWHDLEVLFYKITYISAMLGCDKEDL